MANHAAQVIKRTGTVLTYTAVANGDTCDVGETTLLFVKNGSGGSINVTITAQTGEGGLELEDLVVAVPAGDEMMIGPIIAELFADQGTGKADIAYSSLTSITAACAQL